MTLKTEFLLSDTKAVDALRQLPEEQYYVTHGGRIVHNWEDLAKDAYIHVHLRLRGGKGGFGSLLRSFRIHKSTNNLMCRDLNGRRIADVKEEERLRKWIAKAEQREKVKSDKKKEKYEKLKAGPPKHQLTDPKFKKAHEKIDERVEDAFDAAVKAMKEQSTAEDGESKAVQEKYEESDSGSEQEDADVPGPSWLIKKRKRKAAITTSGEKKMKLAVPEDEQPKVENVIKEAVEFEKPVEVKQVKDEKHSEDNQPVKEEKKIEPPKVFEAIKLDMFVDAASLEALGLDHLKFELESRNLKCGGNLAERAKRLISVKGLTPDKYPKNVRAAPKKK